MATPEFRSFIQSLLKEAKISSDFIEKYTDPEGMQMFLKAFTHKTFDPEFNYEVLEFIGDGIVKAILSQYIPRRFPNIHEEGTLSKIRRYLEQSKQLSDLALKLGFWDHARGDEKTMTQNRKKTLEDIFEAFVGALTEIIDKRERQGVGYIFAQNFVNKQLDGIKIEITVETLDDPITRLNELYKANELKGGKNPLKWGDAVYTQEHVCIPRVETLPTQFKVGDLVFNIEDKTVYVGAPPIPGSPPSWVHISRVPLVKLQSWDTNVSPEDCQKMWVVGVYGFPGGKKGIIGQGVHFKTKEAKKMAANQALNYLKKLGYQKV